MNQHLNSEHKYFQWIQIIPLVSLQNNNNNSFLHCKYTCTFLSLSSSPLHPNITISNNYLFLFVFSHMTWFISEGRHSNDGHVSPSETLFLKETLLHQNLAFSWWRRTRRKIPIITTTIIINILLLLLLLKIMTEVLQLPSSSSCSRRPCGGLTPNDGSHPIPLINAPTVEEQQSVEIEEEEEKERERERDQLSILTLLIATFRKSLIGCSTTTSSSSSMEIGWPSNVRHVAHVTFDRFHGFLGLPVEFEPEVPRRPPSAR